jgi:hypothetical protein
MLDVRQAHSKIRQMFLCGISKGKQRILFYNKDEGKMVVACNGVLLKKEFLSKGVSGSKVQLEEIQETLKNISTPTNPVHDVQDVVPQDVEAPTSRRSTRSRRTTKKLTLLTTEQRDKLLLDNDEPMT